MQSMLTLALIAALHLPFAPVQESGIHLMPDEVKSWNGLYTGTLTYRDYTTGEMEAMNLTGNCYMKGDKLVLDFVINEWGRVYKQHYVYKIQNGTVYSGGAWNLEEKTIRPDGKLRFVISQKGRDGNDRKPCTFRLTFVHSGGELVVTKDVKFDGEKDFFMRNEYRLQRSGQ